LHDNSTSIIPIKYVAAIKTQLFIDNAEGSSSSSNQLLKSTELIIIITPLQFTNMIDRFRKCSANWKPYIVAFANSS
jgi:hypothetical protein